MLNDTQLLIYKQCHTEIGQNQYIEMLSNVSHIARVVDILWTANFDFKRVENQFQDNKFDFQPRCRQILIIISTSLSYYCKWKENDCYSFHGIKVEIMVWGTSIIQKGNSISTKNILPG